MGHRDHEGNFAANKLARAGTTNPVLPEKELVGNPSEACRLKITCRNSRLIWLTRFVKGSARLIAFKRLDCSLAVKAFTKYWLIGAHADRLLVPHNDYCRSCRDEKEDRRSVTHLLCKCGKCQNNFYYF